MTDPRAIPDAIGERPDDGAGWLALAGRLRDNGRDAEAVAVRTYWPLLRDNLTRASLESTLADVTRHAKMLGQRPRESEVPSAE